LQSTAFRATLSDAFLTFQLYHGGVRCEASFSHDDI
jgi:hypothetical protein